MFHLWYWHNLFRQSLLVVVALVACACADEEVQDQEAAEQYMLRYGSWPSWYTTGLTGNVYGAIRSFPIGSTTLLAGSRLIAPTTTMITGSRLISLKAVADMKSAAEEKKEVDDKSEAMIKLLPISTVGSVMPLGLNTWNTWNNGAILL